MILRLSLNSYVSENPCFQSITLCTTLNQVSSLSVRTSSLCTCAQLTAATQGWILCQQRVAIISCLRIVTLVKLLRNNLLNWYPVGSLKVISRLICENWLFTSDSFGSSVMHCQKDLVLIGSVFGWNEALTSSMVLWSSISALSSLDSKSFPEGDSFSSTASTFIRNPLPGITPTKLRALIYLKKLVRPLMQNLRLFAFNYKHSTPKEY